MKLLFVNTTGGYFGGVEQNIALTAEGLRERGHTPYFYCQQASGRDWEGYSRIFERAFSGADGRLQEVLPELGLDSVYIHKLASIQPVLDLAGAGGKKDTAAKGLHLVRMVHDHDLYCPRLHKYYFHNRKICTKPAGPYCWLDLAFLKKDAKARGAWGKLRGLGYRSIGAHIREMKKNCALDTLIVGSSYMREQLITNGFEPSQIHVNPPVLPRDDTQPAPLPKEKRVLYTGQLIRGKGVDLLLDAVSRLRVPFHLDVVGAGNDETFLKEKAAEFGVGERVTFHGWIPHERLAGLYDSARCVVVPSRWPEPFGMVGLEAMQRARPVVAFASGGIPDWLDHGVTGFLVPTGDVAGLAERIEQVLRDGEFAAQMGAAGRKRVDERFSFANYLDELERLLAPPTPPAPLEP